MRMQEGFEGVAHMAYQMKPIGHLERLRGSLAAGHGIGIRTVADQNGDRRMGLQPLDEGLGRTAFEHGHRAPVFQVDQPGAIGHAASEGKCSDAQDAWRGAHEALSALPPDETVGARPLPEAPGDARRDFGAASMRQL